MSKWEIVAWCVMGLLINFVIGAQINKIQSKFEENYVKKSEMDNVVAVLEKKIETLYLDTPWRASTPAKKLSYISSQDADGFTIIDYKNPFDDVPTYSENTIRVWLYTSDISDSIKVSAPRIEGVISLYAGMMESELKTFTDNELDLIYLKLSDVMNNFRPEETSPNYLELYNEFKAAYRKRGAAQTYVNHSSVQGCTTTKGTK